MVSSYVYQVPASLEDAFFDFYAWSFVYQNLNSDEELQAIVTDAVQKVVDKNTQVMQKALVIAISKCSSSWVKDFVTDLNDPTAIRYHDYYKKVVESTPPRLIEFFKHSLHTKLDSFEALSQKIVKAFGSLLAYVQDVRKFFSLIKDEVWGNICDRTIQLLENTGSLDAKILLLDIVYHLEHNSGHVSDYVDGLGWMKAGLEFKFQDRDLAIFRRSSIPEYIWHFILHKLQVDVP